MQIRNAPIQAVLLAAATLCFLPGQTRASYFLSTTAIVSWCESEDEYQLSQCYAYLQALADAVNANAMEVKASVHGNRVPQWKSPICLPSTINQRNLRQAFLSYTRMQADIKGKNPAYVAADAFAAFWPCFNTPQ